MSDEKRIYRVSEINRLIRQTLERTFGSVWIEGELSNVRKPQSGHYYLTIKDASSQISGVLFRGNQAGMKFEPTGGIKIRAYGEISVYEPSGTYQLIIRKMEEAGKGTLQEQFEKLKEKLAKEGLFSEERKKRMPLLPRHVGIVTSRTGAAIRDILNVVNRRFPNMHLVIAPVKVQGEGAAQEISDAIEMLNTRGGLDVMIVGRGGGSLEDLWCFNEEVVARAIAKSEIPVISAVGHEIDFTISDFVADLRAPTPSAAAELVVGRKEEFENQLRAHETALARALRDVVMSMKNRLLELKGSYGFTEPINMLNRMRTRLLRASGSYVFSEPRNIIKQHEQRLDSAMMKMQHSLEITLQDGRQELQRLSGQMKALNPTAVLNRGYSITFDENGRAVKKADDLHKGDKITTRLHNGEFAAEVKGVLRNK